MSHAIDMRIADRDLRISVDDDALFERLQREWRSFAPAGGPPLTVLRCVRADRARPLLEHSEDDVRTVCAEPTAAASGYRVTQALTAEVIKELRGRFLLLHAAAVEIGGRALVLVAPSGTGKSTAARMLCSAADARYLTDETVIIDPRTRLVFPYPKPISAVQDGGTRGGKVDLALADLGFTPCREPVPLGAVVVLERSGPPARWGQMGPTDAMLAVAAQSSSLSLLDHPLTTLDAVLSAVGGGRLLQYAEIDDALPLLLEAPSRSARQAAPTAVRIEPSPPRSKGPWRIPVTAETVEMEDGLLVLREGSLVHLGGAASALWLELLESGARSDQDVRDLVGEDVLRSGSFEEGLALAVRALEGQGLVGGIDPD